MNPLQTISAVPALPPRAANGHKGTFGKVLVVAGSTGMSGAAVLCGLGALRGGAGLVQVATPAPVQPVVAASNPCYLTAALPAGADGALAPDADRPLLELAAATDVVAFGPGLGRGPAVAHVLQSLLDEVDRPLVIDADGLHALGGILSASPQLQRVVPPVCTPHPGEFARLLGTTIDAVQADRASLAARFAAERGVILVLKGQGTVVTDGARLYVNATGNPGLATGGTGDVLTGLVAALIAQGLDPFEAAVAGVYLHGLAGDLARDALGETALIATDVIDCLPAALKRHAAAKAGRMGFGL